MNPDLIDEDADLRRNSRRSASWRSVSCAASSKGRSRTATRYSGRSWRGPTTQEVATLLAMADTDEVMRQRLLWAIGGLGE